MKKYAIICRARAGHKLGIHMLALVDRTITKEFWWTSDNPSIVLEYESHYAAEFACKRLKKNSPTIVDSEDAKGMLRSQLKSIVDAEGDDESVWDAGYEAMEAGWDGHKSWKSGGD